MARSGRFRVAFRRRREGKTDYRLRRKLITSRMERVVIRKTNKNLLIQLITSHMQGDNTHVRTSSQDLRKFDWKGGNGNLPAAYLTGYLFGKRVLSKSLGDEEKILDMGLNRKFYGGRIFAALKGVVDAGVNVRHGADSPIFPADDRIRGEHIAAHAKLLSAEDKDTYNHYFSEYIKRNFKPEELPSHFDAIKAKIDKEK